MRNAYYVSTPHFARSRAPLDLISAFVRAKGNSRAVDS